MGVAIEWKAYKIIIINSEGKYTCCINFYEKYCFKKEIRNINKMIPKYV